MIILKKHVFLLVRAVLVSRLRLSRDSDSQVKSGCSYLIRDGLTLYLGFQTAGKALRLSILAPPIYFCYLFSLNLLRPIRRTFFFRGRGGGCAHAGLSQHDMTATSEV